MDIITLKINNLKSYTMIIWEIYHGPGRSQGIQETISELTRLQNSLTLAKLTWRFTGEVTKSGVKIGLRTKPDGQADR